MEQLYGNPVFLFITVFWLIEVMGKNCKPVSEKKLILRSVFSLTILVYGYKEPVKIRSHQAPPNNILICSHLLFETKKGALFLDCRLRFTHWQS